MIIEEEEVSELEKGLEVEAWRGSLFA